MKTFLYIIYLILGKTIGKVWVFVVMPFRGHARNVAHNGILQFNLPCKRLRERNPIIHWNPDYQLHDGWTLDDVHGLASHQSPEGFITYRPVSKLYFYLVVFFIWGWLDDDANQDTTDTGYIRTLITGERKSWHRIFNPWLRKMNLDVVYGNAFDLGDERAKHPVFNWAAAFVWNDINTAQNFQYMFFDY